MVADTVNEMIIRSTIIPKEILWWPKLKKYRQVLKGSACGMFFAAEAMRSCLTLAIEAMLELVPMNIYVRLWINKFGCRLNIEPADHKKAVSRKLHRTELNVRQGVKCKHRS